MDGDAHFGSPQPQRSPSPAASVSSMTSYAPASALSLESEVVSRFLAYLDRKDSAGRTLLMHACWNRSAGAGAGAGAAPAVARLLDYGANPNLQDSFGHSALHLACLRGNDGAIAALIERGGSLSLLNAKGRAAYECLPPTTEIKEVARVSRLVQEAVRKRQYAVLHGTAGARGVAYAEADVESLNTYSTRKQLAWLDAENEAARHKQAEAAAAALSAADANATATANAVAASSSAAGSSNTSKEGSNVARTLLSGGKSSGSGVSTGRAPSLSSHSSSLTPSVTASTAASPGASPRTTLSKASMASMAKAAAHAAASAGGSGGRNSVESSSSRTASPAGGSSVSATTAAVTSPPAAARASGKMPILTTHTSIGARKNQKPPSANTTNKFRWPQLQAQQRAASNVTAGTGTPTTTSTKSKGSQGDNGANSLPNSPMMTEEEAKLPTYAQSSA